MNHEGNTGVAPVERTHAGAFVNLDRALLLATTLAIVTALGCSDAGPHPSGLAGTWVGPVQETPDYALIPPANRIFHADTLELEGTGLFWYFNTHEMVSTLTGPKVEGAFGDSPALGLCPIRPSDVNWYVSGDTLYLKSWLLALGYAHFIVESESTLVHLGDRRVFHHTSDRTSRVPTSRPTGCSITTAPPPVLRSSPSAPR